MKTFLITGGAGFFGSILKKQLIEQGNQVISIDLQPDKYENANFIAYQGNICDESIMTKIFSQYKFDAVFHCAALLAHVKKDLKKLWASNVEGTRNLLKFCEDHQVPKIIFISSNCLWGKNFNSLVTENETPDPIEIYGKSKLEGEQILLASKMLKSVIFRCPTIMDEGRLGLLGILFDFIDKNKKLWVVGDGSNRYQFIYAKDLANACILAVNYNQSDIFNIGSDNVKSFNEVYSYVIKKSGSSSQIKHLPKQLTIWGMKLCYMLGISPLGPYQYKMIASNFIFDTTKIKTKLGFQPTLTNEEMMLKAYTYYAKNKKEILSRKNVSAHSSVAKMGVIKIIEWLS